MLVNQNKGFRPFAGRVDVSKSQRHKIFSNFDLRPRITIVQLVPKLQSSVEVFAQRLNNKMGFKYPQQKFLHHF